MANDEHEMAAGALHVVVSAVGAELTALNHARAGELLWQGDEPWPRQSPVLFPIVGRLNDDRLRVHGCNHSLSQHGFARDRRFTWVDRGKTGCRLVLEDDAETREIFPFRFRLELRYGIAEDTLTVSYRLSNPDDAPLLASLGAHPGFRWPLAPGVAEGAHHIAFAEEEPDALRRVEAGGLLGDAKPTPVRGRELALSRPLFADGALVFDRPRSRSLRYAAPGKLALEIAWDGFEELGLWAREGGAFLCIEPWRGMADPVGFNGDFAEKPGIMSIAPGAEVAMNWSVRVVEG